MIVEFSSRSSSAFRVNCRSSVGDCPNTSGKPPSSVSLGEESSSVIYRSSSSILAKIKILLGIYINAVKIQSRQSLPLIRVHCLRHQTVARCQTRGCSVLSSETVGLRAVDEVGVVFLSRRGIELVEASLLVHLAHFDGRVGSPLRGLVRETLVRRVELCVGQRMPSRRRVRGSLSLLSVGVHQISGWAALSKARVMAWVSESLRMLCSMVGLSILERGFKLPFVLLVRSR